MNISQEQLQLDKISAFWLAEFPLNWQQWILENIEQGCSSEVIAQVLKQNGFCLQTRFFDFLDNHLDVAEGHPQQKNLKQRILDLLLQNIVDIKIIDVLQIEGYQKNEIEKLLQELKNNNLLQILIEKQHILNKREWLLATLDRLAQLSPSYIDEITKIKAPCFAEFIENYYSQNRAVILTHGIQHWEALDKWNPQYFAKVVGENEIEVQMGRDQDQQFERHSACLKQKMKMKDFVNLIEQTQSSNNFYMTANNSSNSQTALNRLFEDIGNFADNYCDLKHQNHMCFVWFGAKGTFTPLHHDLTNNMLVQIYGRKRVTLIPALEVTHLYNDQWVFSKISDPHQFDFAQYPNLSKVRKVECILAAGEALFIPIGWWHSVESLDISISLSFTHFNTINSFSHDFPRGLDE